MTEQRILVTQAAPGMILARPVQLPDRMVLVGEGVTISEQLIGQLMNRGIKRIVVRGSPIPSPRKEDWATRVRQLDLRFSRIHRYPFMTALRDVVARVLASRM